MLRRIYIYALRHCLSLTDCTDVKDVSHYQSEGCFSVGYKPIQCNLTLLCLEGQTGVEDGWPQALPLQTGKCLASKASTSQQDVSIILHLTGPYRAGTVLIHTHNIRC